MKTWITADWHLGENRFDLMGRPFTTPEEHVDTLIKNHNAVVGKDDTVVVVGDVCYQKEPTYLPYVARFNGRKVLLRGNHDRVFTDEQLKPFFNKIVPEGEGIRMTDVQGQIPLYITHYPTEGVKDAFNLVGHIHGAWKYQLNMLNIGVDVHHFRPVDMSTIEFHYNAVCKFYDNDVWVAYDEKNAFYRPTRGKQNSYFRP